VFHFQHLFFFILWFIFNAAFLILLYLCHNRRRKAFRDFRINTLIRIVINRERRIHVKILHKRIIISTVERVKGIEKRPVVPLVIGLTQSVSLLSWNDMIGLFLFRSINTWKSFIVCHLIKFINRKFIFINLLKKMLINFFCNHKLLKFQLNVCNIFLSYMAQ